MSAHDTAMGWFLSRDRGSITTEAANILFWCEFADLLRDPSACLDSTEQETALNAGLRLLHARGAFGLTYA
jgi:hypothetical protein